MDSFLKKRTLESECEDPKDDTSDALVVPESKRPNPGFGVEGVNDIASSLAESPFQPILKHYPKRKFGSRERSFQKDWYRNRNWLEYSQKEDAAFCYCCRAFTKCSSSDQWTKIGFANWKNATEEGRGLKANETSVNHIEAAAMWSNFENAQQSGSIAMKLSIISRQNILDNRHYIKSVAQVVAICAVQDLPFRGHREGRIVDDEGNAIDHGFNCGFRNRGNFLEILGSFAVHDDIVRKKLRAHGSLNAQYTHHSVQNEILGLLALAVRKDILDTLKDSKYFSLLCDECKDIGKDEQLSVCIRYVAGGTLHEDFYNFIRAEGLDARSVLARLKDVISGMEVDAASHLVAQCYDGASVMAGHLNGLQALMRQEVCPMGIYVHCWAHRLNLVVVSSIQGIHKASSFFSNMATLHSFLSASVPHNHFVKTQKDLGEDGVVKGKALQQHELKSISKTRWCCQAEACDAVVATLGAIIQTIEHFAEDSVNAERRTAAQAIDNFLDTDFVVCFSIFQRLLTKAAIVSN